MSAPAPVQNIQVVNLNKFTRDRTITWDPILTPIIGYNVYRSEVSYGDFAKLNTSLLASTIVSFSDTPPQTAVLPFQWFYKVTAVSNTNQESDLNLTLPAQDLNIDYFVNDPYDPNQPQALSEQNLTKPLDGSNFQVLSNTHVNPRWFLEIRRRHKWLLEIGGTRVALLKRRYSGTLCPLFDVNREQHPQRANDTATDPCYGTGYIGGYHVPLDIQVSFISPTLKTSRRKEEGVWFEFEPKCWTLWEPNLLDRDILVRKDTGQRFEVIDVTRTTWRGMTLRQNFDVRFIEPNSIEYKFPVP